jgi:hypothetical protein
MRNVSAILLSACLSAAFSSVPLRADYSYERRIQITSGELYNSLLALGPRTPGIRDAVVTTNLIKGSRMAMLSKGHTSVIDLAGETITEIEFSKKTYSVLPFAQIKKLLEDAVARVPQEDNFKISVQKPGGTKIMGILNATESIISIEGATNRQTITVDSWIGTVPGYEQMIDFNRRLAEKMGDAYASGMAQLALNTPQTLQGFGEAAKALNKASGVPLMTTIKIAGSGGTLAEASIQLDDFGGGIQDGTKFDPPAGFKKVDAVLPGLLK